MILNFRQFIKESAEENIPKRRLTKEERRIKYQKPIDTIGKVLTYEDLENYDIPDDIKNMMKNWDIIYKSPFSDSFYSSKDISWKNKPNNSYRVSDHWNFRSKRDDNIHCPTDKKTPNTTHISIGRYDGRNHIYHIIKTEPTKNHLQMLDKKRIREEILKNSDEIEKRRQLKRKIEKREIAIYFEYIGDKDSKNWSGTGLVSKWNGYSLKIENPDGDEIYNNDSIRNNFIKKIKLWDINTDEIVENPYNRINIKQ